MAWFKRNRDEAPPGGDDPLDAVAPQAAPAPAPEHAGSGGTVPPAAPAGPMAAPAWTTAAPMPSVVPTIQRMLGQITAQNTTTLGKPAPLALAPLGHAVTPDAPAGMVTALSDPGSASGVLGRDQAPLEYVQRAPAGAVPARPAQPAQLLVPAFQPSQPGRPPSIPTVPPAVQRAPDSPSFTTAPPPEPPLVLPVGEILPPPALPAAPAPSPGPMAAAPTPAAGGAPLLARPAAPPAEAGRAAGPDVQRAAVELPLASVQRHADHPGHVDGDEAPTQPEAAAVQRASVDAPAAAPVTTPTPADAPLLAGPAAPPAEAAPAGTPDVQRTPVALPLAPVQRHADHPGHVDGDEAPDVQRAPVDARVVGPAPTPATPATPADAPLLADAPLTPAAPLMAPEAAAMTGMPAAPQAPEVDLPLAPVQRHAEHPGRAESDEAPADPPGTHDVPEVQRAAVDASVAPVAAEPPLATAPLVGDAAPLVGDAVPDAAPPAPETPTRGAELPLPGAPVQRSASPRRPAGLGRPIPSVPTDAVAPGTVQRAPLPAPPAVSPTASPAASSVPPLDLAQRAPLDGGSAAPAAESATSPAPPMDGQPLTAPLLGQQPMEPTIGSTADLELVQRAPAASAGSSAPTSAASTRSSSSSATTPTAATPPLLVVAPLLGGRPFSTHVQRTADGRPGTASAPAGLVDRSSPEALSPVPGQVYQPLAGIGMWNGAPPPDLPGPAIEAPPGHVAAAVQRATGSDVSNVRIRRDTGPTAQRLAARAFTHEGEVHIPSSVGSLASGEGASLATHELVHAGQQSVLGSSRPHEHTPEGQHLEAQARSAEHASLAGIELPKLPLVPPTSPAVQRAPSEGASSSPFSSQQLSRLIDLADNPPSSGAAVQRVLVDDPPQAPQRPSMPAPSLPPGPPEHEHTPQELEELATKLFPTLRNLFRSELLGFRRRSGTSSDRPLS